MGQRLPRAGSTDLGNVQSREPQPWNVAVAVVCERLKGERLASGERTDDHVSTLSWRQLHLVDIAPGGRKAPAGSGNGHLLPAQGQQQVGLRGRVDQSPP